MRIDTLEGMLETMKLLQAAEVSTPGGPIDYAYHEPPDSGPYLTFAEYSQLVEHGAIGPDESCWWVCIDPMGNLVEYAIHNPYEAMPSNAICVAYYAA
jgi:hypothetical protein